MPRNLPHSRWIFVLAIAAPSASGGNAEPVTLQGESYSLSYPYIGSGMAVLSGHTDPALRLQAVVGQTGDRNLSAAALYLEGGVLHRPALSQTDSIFADGFEGETR